MKRAFSYACMPLLVLTLITGCSNKDEEVPQDPDETAKGLQVSDVFPSLRFTSPVDIQPAHDGSNRLFVVEQAGVIKVFNNTNGASTATVFLDIKSKVTAGGERGLLGLAFHPDFKTNGLFFVNYTTGSPLKTVVSRFKASGNVADPASEAVLLTFAQPFDNHNGGALQFGPDGFLYIATGDGGSGGDPQNNAQNKKSMLGKILRLDVNSTTEGNYGIPADNPFASATDAYPEIFALGLRNPWRISFDTETKQLLVADVGQNEREEINIVTNGGNYGWRIKEGFDCYNPSSNCNTAGLTEPIFDYNQSNGDRSITGGYVYQGAAMKDLRGKYIYGDYVSGKIWSLEIIGNKAGENKLLFDNAGQISTFGLDEAGEVYFANYREGKLMKLVRKD